MASIADPPDTTSTCTAPHVDGCPECVVNVEPPLSLERRQDGCSASYRCGDCAHTWATNYGRCI